MGRGPDGRDHAQGCRTLAALAANPDAPPLDSGPAILALTLDLALADEDPRGCFLVNTTELAPYDAEARAVVGEN